eukprot:gene9539-11694_t
MTDQCLTFRDLTLGYRSHPAVHHLSGVVERGSLTAVVGANGSGKSTLMKGIVGVLKPMSGSVVVEKDVRVAYLPQQSELDRSFPARVIDLVSLGLWPRRGLLGRFTAGDPFPRNAAFGAQAHCLGRLAGDASSGKPAARAAVPRGLGRECALVRRRCPNVRGRRSWPRSCT